MSFSPAYTYSTETRLGETLTVSLLREDYSGGEDPMLLGNPPLTRQASKRESDELIGLQPQVVEVRMSPTHEHVVKDVYSSDDRWRVRVELDGALDFLGPIRKTLRDTSADKFSEDPLVLNANGGLGTLQGQSFEPISDDPVRSRGWRIVNVLQELGLGLDVAMASEFWAPHMDETQNPLFQEYIGQRSYRGEDGWMDYYDVLNELVSEKGMFLVQERGMWHCYQRQLFRSSTFDRWIYPFDYVPGSDPTPSAETYEASVQASTPGYTERLKGGTNKGVASRDAVEVAYNHGTTGNVVPGYNYQNSQNWALDDGVDDFTSPFVWFQGAVEDNGNPVENQLTERARLEESVRLLEDWQYVLQPSWDVLIGDDAQDGEPYDLLGYVKMGLELADGSQYYLKRQVSQDPDDSNRFVYEDPIWTQDSSHWTAWIVAWNGSHIVRMDADLTVPDLPGTGALHMEVGNVIDPLPNRFGEQTAYTVKAKVPVLQPVGPDGNQIESTTYRAEATQTSSDKDPYKVEVETGSGPTALHISSARESDVDFVRSGELITDWDTAPMAIGDDGPLAAPLLARVLLYQLAPPNERALEYTFREEAVACGLTKAIVKDGTVYLPKSLEHDYMDRMRSVVAPPVVYDESISISTQRVFGDSGGSGGGGGGGSGSSGGGGVSNWRSIAGKPDEIFSRSGEGGTVTIGQSDIASALGHGPGLAVDVPFKTVDSDGNPVARGAAFTDGDDATGDGDGFNVRWMRDPANDLALKVVNEETETDLLTLDEEGNLKAEGDVSAFASDSGGGSGGGGTEFQPGRSLSLDSTTDPDTLDVALVGGTNVSLSTDANNNYVIDVPNAGAVDSVFGRTGSVAAQSGDYDHSQLGAISSDDHHTRYSDEEAQDAVGDMVGPTLFYNDFYDTIGVNEDKIDAGSVDGYEGSELAVLAENETVSGSWVYTSGLYADGSHDADQDDICNIAAVFNIHDGGSKYLTGSTKWSGANGRWEYTRDTAGAWRMDLGNDPISFLVAPSGIEGNEASYTDVWQADSDGQMGIGRTPSYRLDVAGTARAQDAFRTSGWRIHEVGGSIRIEDTNNGDSGIEITKDGDVIADNDVSAFGSGSGSGGGGTEFQAGRSLSQDTGTDPDTLNVDLVGGANVSLSTDGNDNYVIDVPNAGAVDSVFGRTGTVTAQSGDYSHSQISGISTDDHHTRYSDSEARGAVKAGIDYVDFTNKERSDYNADGRVYWDKSEGLYVKSSNASHADPALLWSSANVDSSAELSVSYDSEDTPYLAVVESEIDHDSLSGISSNDHHTRYSDEEAQDAVGDMVDPTLFYNDFYDTNYRCEGR